MATSAEVLQELHHAYLPVGRLATLESGRTSQPPGCCSRGTPPCPLEICSISRPCQRHGATRVLTYDRQLAAAFAD
jgi:hypothetical protein